MIGSPSASSTTKMLRTASRHFNHRSIDLIGIYSCNMVYRYNSVYFKSSRWIMETEVVKQLTGKEPLSQTCGEAGSSLGVITAVPSKRALRNDARKLGAQDALAEIIDNAIDNFAKQKGRDRAA